MNQEVEQAQLQIGMLQLNGCASLQTTILQTLGIGECLRVAIAPVAKREAGPPTASNRVVLEIEDIKAKLRIQIEEANLPGCVLNENGQLFWVRKYSAPPTQRNLSRIYRALLDSGFKELDLAASVMTHLLASEGEQTQ